MGKEWKLKTSGIPEPWTPRAGCSTRSLLHSPDPTPGEPDSVVGWAQTLAFLSF